MAERWRKPVVPITVNDEIERVEVTIGAVGVPRFRREVELVLKDQDVLRMRHGYVCAYCLEPFENAWPIQCPVCKFPVRERQAQYFADSYKGTDPETRSTQEILEGFWEQDDREAHQGGSQVLLPRGVSAS